MGAAGGICPSDPRGVSVCSSLVATRDLTATLPVEGLSDSTGPTPPRTSCYGPQ